MAAAERSDTLSRGGDNYNLQPNELNKNPFRSCVCVCIVNVCRCFFLSMCVRFAFVSELKQDFPVFDFLAGRVLVIF
jgi:hypothetical protein